MMAKNGQIIICRFDFRTANFESLKLRMPPKGSSVAKAAVAIAKSGVIEKKKRGRPKKIVSQEANVGAKANAVSRSLSSHHHIKATQTSLLREANR